MRVHIADPAEYVGRSPEDRARAAENNAAIFAGAGPIVGIEVLTPALAARCSGGNIDPQHGQHAPAAGWPEPLPGEAACAYALRLRDAGIAPPAGVVLERSGPRSGDLDGWAAAAVLDAVTLPVALRDRAAAVAAADSFVAPREWRPSPLPTKADPWPAGAEASVDSRRACGAVNLLCQDGALAPEWRLAVVSYWLRYGEPDALSMESPDEARALAGARLAVERARHTLVEEIALPGALQVSGGIAVVQIATPGPLGVGYAVAPVVIARHPTTGKVTIAAWQADLVDFAGLVEALNGAEKAYGGTPAWGGNLASGIIGSPFAGTRLHLSFVAPIVRRHVRR